MSNPQFWAVIPAAGIGSRMASDRPKQYLSLNNKTVIEHSLEKLLVNPQIAGVYVAIAEHDRFWAELDISKHPKVQRVDGGSERADSVLNALQAMAVDQSSNIQPNDWVLVHDAARPCLRPESLQALIESLADDAVGGILANPVSDTIKRVASDNHIQQTIDRRALWQAQTPQMFRFELLRESLQNALAQNVAITDEASAIEWAGQVAKVVPGPSDNIKITRPEDLALAQFILSRQTAS
ncbi:2-C-methyl-D-erythritol 4-phosphate cytidylyltransferase [uncultured Pseudoteredinibacter sp.]|uniref:2-C-methyl-D-erythritol 4-phosphate cytidylyltransferase n=1 Tax=uncultured Pseudoteredinibacter sp. TaxID=1641701 RepID=UPI00261E824A|nr:2-C-methyl-D-erythritol 4-phosphate cytidylyltransferase [uncultured Pseudoteredinibacter sp.]